MSASAEIRRKNGLVLSGVTAEADLGKFAYRPGHVMKDLGAILGE